MILVLDYGMSNLRSVSKALEKLGAEVEVSNRAEAVEKAQKLVLPGVGAFGDAMKELESRNLAGPIRKFTASGRPFLGICLGLQLLFDSSDENPGVKGLGVLPGEVRRFTNSKRFKVPHMGWNQLEFRNEKCPLTKGIKNGAFVYFVHSYFVRPASPDVVLADCNHGTDFAAMIWQHNVFGCQFHPEKSQDAGMKMLENFISL
ncbi:MAG: imidazole glycerol phosphate synthase, glutamine amidotransferase subunit [Omnitrophica bacterium GWA2_50_21]|nr:MAG: imidazole glycerol phosphate synthase, glutamine amidotransferase subunit [Omnitrophica bacterium GWA2_50_21]